MPSDGIKLYGPLPLVDLYGKNIVSLIKYFGCLFAKMHIEYFDTKKPLIHKALSYPICVLSRENLNVPSLNLPQVAFLPEQKSDAGH